MRLNADDLVIGLSVFQEVLGDSKLSVSASDVQWRPALVISTKRVQPSSRSSNKYFMMPMLPILAAQWRREKQSILVDCALQSSICRCRRRMQCEVARNQSFVSLGVHLVIFNEVLDHAKPSRQDEQVSCHHHFSSTRYLTIFIWSQSAAK